MNAAASLPDPLTALCHRLIRKVCHDDMDPFMVGNQGDVPTTQTLVRACFYYAVAMTPRTTVLFDNQGRGGMCDMVGEEIVAAWDTPALLASQGLSFESAMTGRDVLKGSLETVPEPWEVFDDLEPQALQKFDPTAFPVRQGFVGHMPLSCLLKADARLLLMMAEAHAPDTIPAPSHSELPIKPPRGPGPKR